MTSTSSCEHEKGAQSLKVRACTRTMSTRLDLVPCLPACHDGCLWLPGYPALRATFFGPHARTHGSLERCAPPRRPRWQDASSWWTRRVHGESGSSAASTRAPESVPRRLSRSGPQTACARCRCAAVRVRRELIGPGKQVTVPVSCTNVVYLSASAAALNLFMVP